MTTSLTDLMAAALRDVSDISDLAARARAYIDAGIELHDLPRDDARNADEAAVSIELSKRMGGHHDA